MGQHRERNTLSTRREFHRIVITLCAIGLLWGTAPPIVHARTVPDNVYEKPEPAYAKWGKIAVAETKRQFPQFKVVDYKYLGHSESGSEGRERFRLWLRGDRREFGVNVTVRYDKASQKLLSVKVERLQ